MPCNAAKHCTASSYPCIVASTTPVLMPYQQQQPQPVCHTNAMCVWPVAACLCGLGQPSYMPVCVGRGEKGKLVQSLGGPGEGRHKWEVVGEGMGREKTISLSVPWCFLLCAGWDLLPSPCSLFILTFLPVCLSHLLLSYLSSFSLTFYLPPTYMINNLGIFIFVMSA